MTLPERIEKQLEEIKRQAFLIPAPNAHTPVIVQLVMEIERSIQFYPDWLETKEQMAEQWRGICKEYQDSIATLQAENRELLSRMEGDDVAAD